MSGITTLAGLAMLGIAFHSSRREAVDALARDVHEQSKDTFVTPRMMDYLLNQHGFKWDNGFSGVDRRDFRTGDAVRVTHRGQDYGKGVITHIDRRGGHIRYSVQFRSGGHGEYLATEMRKSR